MKLLLRNSSTAYHNYPASLAGGVLGHPSGLASGNTGVGLPKWTSRGFTLIELMVVIIILGLLAAIVMPRVVGETDRARYEQAKVQMRILEDALKRYKLDNGVYPTTEQGLEALVRKPSAGILPRKWPEGGYLDKTEIPIDPWGNPYIYISPGLHSPDYDLRSFGADGLEGGEGYNADIESWRVQ